MSRLIILVCGCLLALGLVAVDNEEPGEAVRKPLCKDYTVKMKDNSFDPKELTINVGDTVTWSNEGCNTHTATSDTGVDKDNAFDTKDVTSGKKSKAVKFSKAGAVAYHCKHHGSMTGTITVK